MRNGASRLDQDSPRQGQVHKTACRLCRHRKVKCDKTWPCLNCQQAQHVCDFPSPIRTVNRPKKSQRKSSSEHSGDSRSVQERLDHIETLLSQAIPFARPNYDAPANPNLAKEVAEEEPALNSASFKSGSRPRGHPGSPTSLDSPGSSSTFANRPSTMNSSNEVSRGPINIDRWALETETEANLELVPDMFQPAPDSSSAQRVPTAAAVGTSIPSSNGNSSSLEGFPLQSLDGLLLQSSDTFPLQTRHGTESPPLAQLSYRRIYWDAFVHNVDPIVRLLHKPTAVRAFMVPDVNHYKTEPSMAVMIHGVCLLAAISMPTSEVRVALGCDKTALVNSLNKTMEAALTAANFLASPCLVTLQGLVLYLYALKCNEDPRLVALGGTAIKVAEQMRLNEDGVGLGYGPLEVELRRRVWWQLVLLGDRIDDCSTRPVLLSCLSDTRLPLNINDDEVSEAEDKFSPEQAGFTESSFCLMQYDIVRTFHKITLERDYLYAMQKPSHSEAEQQIVTLTQTLMAKYIQRFDYDKPLETFVADVMSMILAKRRLLVHTSLKSGDQAKARTKNQQDRLFLLGVQILELSRSIQTDARLERWRWLNGTYFQWSVTSLVLRELAVRPRSHITTRAWHVVDGILNDWPESTQNCRKAMALTELMASAISNLSNDQSLWNKRLADPSMTLEYNQHRTPPDRNDLEQERMQAFSGDIRNELIDDQIFSPSISATLFTPDLVTMNMLDWN
ncbi:hypothetical protein IQ07DRAFT_584226 [Pyrenochaeta sp. DS3sAY3a]|nr:hypothetical protein IQ07DRAFT_584226 [Pyrenochaeta sp. DS3sAY3a]